MSQARQGQRLLCRFSKFASSSSTLLPSPSIAFFYTRYPACAQQPELRFLWLAYAPPRLAIYLDPPGLPQGTTAYGHRPAGIGLRVSAHGFSS
jgi:hypothetical protein